MASAKMSTFLLLTLIIIFCSHASHAVIDSDLEKSLSTLDTSTEDVLINFAGGNSPAILNIELKTFETQTEKVTALCSELEALADLTQSPLKSLLKTMNVKSESFWASNQMVIKNANLLLLQLVDSFPQVSRIQKLPQVTLAPILPPKAPVVCTEPAEWGIKKIQADLVWNTSSTRFVTGKDVVVAHIDSGVRVTHHDLLWNWRWDRGWFDPYTFTIFPDDGNGHGTHTMGTICGGGGVGVAPDALWISCRGCDAGGRCNGDMLFRCGQWMLRPTDPDGESNPDENLRPDVISNSWGSLLGGDPWYDGIIIAWTTAGILHVFAIGNSGPLCASTGSPGDSLLTIGVGSTDKFDQLSRFSSKGPSTDVLIGGTSTWGKPDIVAPGGDICSCWYTGDIDDNIISGTSMATPHVAGTIALVVSAIRNLTENKLIRPWFVAVKVLLEDTADRKDLTVPLPNLPCDVDGLCSRFPNYQFGYGRVNAFKAVKAVFGSYEVEQVPAQICINILGIKQCVPCPVNH